MIKLIVGLGNPGPKYDDTRHNAGFWWVDAAARQLGTALVMDKAFHGLVARTTVAGQHRYLLEPQTFMNVSGKSVAALARFFKLAPEEILVVHDELDLAPGQLKLKLGGSHAGHNGLKDIHAQLGSANYWRLKIGIGHPGTREQVIAWVLEKPILDHRIAIEQTIDKSIKLLPEILAGDMEKAMLTLHTKAESKPKAAKPQKQTQGEEAVNARATPAPKAPQPDGAGSTEPAP
jgi:peptidyl-tRNA hydrolase, PTH1 family